MEEEYVTEFLIFRLKETKPKTTVWSVISKNQDMEIGEIKWYGSWRQYAFFPEGDTIWNNGCLSHIIGHINLLMNDRAKKLKKE